jgi:hypothetical protein
MRPICNANFRLTPGPLAASMTASPSLPLGRAAGFLEALMADVDFVACEVAAVPGAVGS